MVDSDNEVISREEASRYGRAGTSALVARLQEIDFDKEALRVRVRKEQKAGRVVQCQDVVLSSLRGRAGAIRSR